MFSVRPRSSRPRRRAAPRLAGLASLIAAGFASPFALAQGGPDAASASTPAPPEAIASDAPALRAMTLDEALRYALAHQPSLLAARARLEAAQADQGIAGGMWLPRLGASAQALEATANNSSASYFTVGAIDIPRVGGTRSPPPTSWSPSASTFAGLGLRQEIFDFGRIHALALTYEAASEEARAQGDAAKLDVTMLVEEAFYGVRGAEAVLVAARAAEKRAGAHRDEASAGVKNGMRSPIELTRAEADLARFEVGTLRAQGGVAIARVTFAAAVGVPERALEVSGADPTVSPPPQLSRLDELAGRDPAVRAAHAELLRQQGVTKQARGELLPDLSLGAGINGRAGGAAPTSGDVPGGHGWLPEIPNWDVGLVLSWPIFDASSLARAGASKAREAQAIAEEEKARLDFSAAVLRAREELQVAIEALPALQRAAEAAAANDAQAEARFKAGLGNAVELADAEALRLQAEIELAQGRFDEARARARLARAVAEGL